MVTVNVACCASCRVQFELDPKPFQSAISVAPRDTRAAVDVPKPSKFADRSKPKADPMLGPADPDWQLEQHDYVAALAHGDWSNVLSDRMTRCGCFLYACLSFHLHRSYGEL